MYDMILMLLIYTFLVCGIIGGLDFVIQLLREHYKQEKYLPTKEYTIRIEVACLLVMIFLIAVVNFLGYGY